MNKPKPHSHILVLALVTFLLPAGAVFGFSYIDLGLLHGGAGVEVETDASLRLETGTSSSETEIETIVGSDTAAEAGERNIRVMRSDANVSINITPSMVNSEASLAAFASSTINADKNLEAIAFTDEEVVITYKQQGRLLAFLPLSYSVTARATADAHVEVKYPWYSFLIVNNREEVEAGMKAAVREVLDERSTASASLTATEAARVAERMHAVLAVSLEVDKAVNVNDVD